jgi:hypothetical protein
VYSNLPDFFHNSHNIIIVIISGLIKTIFDKNHMFCFHNEGELDVHICIYIK